MFLDRDGTIVEDRGHLAEPAQVVFFDDTVAALKRLQPRVSLFVVTNQSGVARGIISEEHVRRVNAFVTEYLARHGIGILETYVCPHDRTDGCRCIKPKPHFLKQAEARFGIDLGRSFVVGDHPHDVELAHNVGATGIYVLSGHGMKHRDELTGSPLIAAGIREAVEQIMARTAVPDTVDRRGEPRC